jgi:2-polyprenyl-3-methyl-5-hydroxy-6-metoxy-1,4-benzoquinol methylase
MGSNRLTYAAANVVRSQISTDICGTVRLFLETDAMGLTDLNTHFEFGKNWQSYARTIDQKRIDSANDGVRKLFPEGLAGKTVLDIGCGSGLHSLAALNLGAASLTAIDIDENSVSTTRELLAARSPGSNWTARIASVFDISAETLGKFDIVYSWGVLHHTGDMWRAIECATKLVRSGGLLAIAIYAATPYDNFWKSEKRFYSRAPRAVQWLLRQVYMTAFLLARTIKSHENPASYVKDYLKMRGMNFSHDVHDWLGGYPYETATATELHERICQMGFAVERSFQLPPASGRFGSGCQEFVFRKL